MLTHPIKNIKDLPCFILIVNQLEVSRNYNNKRLVIFSYLNHGVETL